MLTPLQSSPLAQLRPEQHGCPSPPQVWQVSRPVVESDADGAAAAGAQLSEQQGSPDRPQATQLSLLHTVLPAVQRLFEQHASPRPPQRVPPSVIAAAVDHTGDARARRAGERWPRCPSPAQAAPAPTQVAPLVEVQQQPPSLHRLPEQQASPAAPQI